MVLFVNLQTLPLKPDTIKFFKFFHDINCKTGNNLLISRWNTSFGNLIYPSVLYRSYFSTLYLTFRHPSLLQHRELSHIISLIPTLIISIKSSLLNLVIALDASSLLFSVVFTTVAQPSQTISSISPCVACHIASKNLTSREDSYITSMVQDNSWKIAVRYKWDRNKGFIFSRITHINEL